MKIAIAFLFLPLICISQVDLECPNDSASETEFAQLSEPEYFRRLPRRRPTKQNQAIYLEIAGSGGFGSLNFEWKFATRGKFRWMLRTGFSASYIDANNGAILIFPVMVHAVYSPKTQKHSIDFGIGQTLSITTHGSFFVRTPLSLGYRIDSPFKRFFYRFSYTPIISNIVAFQWEHWGGITIGYKLKPHF